jgi:DNA-binding CsgD family transcriptional regulator/tetratricopeptide (TPR) repeat protein
MRRESTRKHGKEAVSASDESGELLERTDQLCALGDSLSAVVSGSGGRLVLVAGEAGVGKTVLLKRFCDDQSQSARTLWGACDALLTPGPLEPLFDIAAVTGGELEELVSNKARPHEIVGALLRELDRRPPAVLVLEDVHWADEATLDVLRLLCRRIQRVRALILASFRDDELELTHPLRTVIGELATERAVARLEVPPLSESAVLGLAEGSGLDGQDLYLKTNGNPFFVNEVLAARTEDVPTTVRDAVLARAARLSAPARRLIEAAAVVPKQVEVWLLEALTEEAVDRLDECLASGMLIAVPAGVAFRHELARLVIEAALAPDRRVELNRRAVSAIAASPSGRHDLDRLAHHAEAAGEADAVLRFAPAAAARAASLGAHREAAAHYESALRFAGVLAADAQGDLFERRAFECYLTGQFTQAIEAQERALVCRREIGDPCKEGDSLRSLSRLLRFVGRTEEAAEIGQEAIAQLEPLPAGQELAMAYNNLAHLFATAEDRERTVEWGTRALVLAERLDDLETRIYALISIGAAEVQAGLEEGRAKLERCIELGRRAGLEDHVGRAFVNLVWWPIRNRDYALVRRFLVPGLEYCDERGLDLWWLFLLACRARLELDEGRLDEAADSAAIVLRNPRAWPVPRIYALAVLGLVRARRGDPEVWPLLDEAQTLAEPTGELQRIAPAATARAEACWLEGRRDAIIPETEVAFELALRRGALWAVGELACWRRRAGGREAGPSAAAEPYALEIAGEYAHAAQLWTEMGCAYEAALVRAQAEDEKSLRMALEELQRRGAQPASAIVARRLRERGAQGLPRGPRPTTRKNPAGLTARELQVLELVSQGLRDAEIAERLFLSEKTVGHHVSAILRKLDVRTRGKASAEAARLGLATQDR